MDDPEIWRQVLIPFFSTYLEASSLGRIRTSSQIMKPSLAKKTKYMTITLKRERMSRTVLVHRLVASAFHGYDDPSLDVNHKNRIRSDNRSDNLEWMTRQQNLNHAIEDDVQKMGEISSKSRKIDTAVALELLLAGHSTNEVGRRLGIEGGAVRSTIESHVRRGLWPKEPFAHLALTSRIGRRVKKHA